jgi:hypothetical protein
MHICSLCDCLHMQKWMKTIIYQMQNIWINAVRKHALVQYIPIHTLIIFLNLSEMPRPVYFITPSSCSYFCVPFFYYSFKFNYVFLSCWGTQERSWLRHYATSQKVAGSIPDEATGFFNWPNPSRSTMAPGPTQPLTEMSTRNLPRGKGWPVHKADNLTAICEPTL